MSQMTAGPPFHPRECSLSQVGEGGEALAKLINLLSESFILRSPVSFQCKFHPLRTVGGLLEGCLRG